MTEYELTDTLYSIFENMNTSASMYFTVVSAYLIVSFFVGERLTKVQLVIVNTLYTVWVLGIINGMASIVPPAVKVSLELEAMGAIVSTQGSTMIALAVYGFNVVQFGGIIASLYFMWNVRHSKTE